jgi:hypothetical protein
LPGQLPASRWMDMIRKAKKPSPQAPLPEGEVWG